MQLNKNLGVGRVSVALSALLLAASSAVIACGPDEGTDKPSGGGGAGNDGGASGTGGGDPGGGGTDPGAGGTDPGAGGGGPGAGGTDPGAGGSNAGGSGPLPPFDAGSDANRNDVTAGNVCARLATIQCAGQEHCCQNPGQTRADCETAVAAACRDAAFLDAISADFRAGFDATRAATAFTEFERRASLCDTTIGLWATTADGLRGIAQGTVAPGANCTPSALDINDQEKVAGHLASCTGPADNACLPGTTIGATWQCEARGGAGARCFSDANCQDAFYCPNPSLALAGATCTAKKADGQPCGFGNECTSFTCFRSTCVPATSQTAYCLTPPS